MKSIIKIITINIPAMIPEDPIREAVFPELVLLCLKIRTVINNRKYNNKKNLTTIRALPLKRLVKSSRRCAN